MAEMPKQIEVDARKMARQVTVRLKITHEREILLRARFGMWLIKLAGQIMMSKITAEIVAPKIKNVPRRCR